jgi:hypothetical protein
MQGDRCMIMHNVMMMQKIKEQTISNKGNFSGSLHLFILSPLPSAGMGATGLI